MSKYIADPAFNGTLERAFALILDHYIIFTGVTDGGKQTYITNGATWDQIVEKLVVAARDGSKYAQNEIRYRAVINRTGSTTQYLYGKNHVKLMDRAIRALTDWEPGFASTWPKSITLQRHVRAISGNQAEWSDVRQLRYEDIPQHQHEWRRRKAERQSMNVAAS